MENIVVELQSGLVRGVIEKDDFNYYAFKGIPYAEPPLNELRFEDPVPIRKWNGIKDCNNYGPMCFQQDFFSGITSYNEDCLYLNVFSREIENPNLNQAVMIIIHAGALLFGSSDDTMYGPEYLIKKDIVLVTVNFRLGVLGFLNLESEVAPGNQGIRDLLLALNWIQQNIRVFGGNPDNVTIFGVGGSGATAHALALSPLTKGLIHKVISQTCNLYNTLVNIPNPRSYAIKLCSLLGEQLTDPRDILKFLKTVDAKSLLEAQGKIIYSENCVSFGIGVDSKSSNPILPIDRYLAADQGVQLPYLTGCASDEGIVALHGLSRKEYFEKCNQDFRNIFKFNSHETVERYNLEDAQIRQLYYDDETVSDKNLDKFVNLATDIYFIEGIHRMVRVQVERSSAPIYLYKFSYDSPFSFIKQVIEDAPAGAAHFDDLPFLFKTRIFEQFGLKYFEKGTKEYEIMDQMTEMFTNFAKYGKPTIATSDLTPVQWQPVENVTNLSYLKIDKDITMQSAASVEQKLTAAKSIKI